MQVFRSKSFRPERAWQAALIANMNGITSRLHWTDQDYHWHVNDGEEVFAVLDGIVDMHVKVDGDSTVLRLNCGDVLHVEAGDEHKACPIGEARILVVETQGSI